MNKKRVTCIYHSRDLDGWMSAAIVNMWLRDVDFIGWDYGDKIPNLDDSGPVIMVDISFPKDVMCKIDKECGLTWIDHHISAIKENEEVRNDWGGKQDTKKAACELTWEYLYPTKDMPELVRLLGRYDCFGHKGTPEEQKVLEFQYGARLEISNVNEAFQTLIIDAGRGDFSMDADVCDVIHEKGKTIYKYLCTEAKQIYNRVFPVNIDGCIFACVNQERFNPINFGIDYHKDGYDGFLCYHYQNNQYNYSLYNDNGKVDCSVIAKEMGGGGHKGAAGWRSNYDPLRFKIGIPTPREDN